VYVWQYKTQVLKLAAASSETAADSSSSSKASKASSGMGSSGVGRERVLDCSLAERKVHEAGGADQVIGEQGGRESFLLETKRGFDLFYQI
jgi:hypothetical protein